MLRVSLPLPHVNHHHSSPLNTLFKIFSGSKKCYKYKQRKTKVLPINTSKILFFSINNQPGQGVEISVTTNNGRHDDSSKKLPSLASPDLSLKPNLCFFVSLLLQLTNSQDRVTFSTASAAKEKLADERTKDTGFRSVADKALHKQGYGGGKTDQQAEEKEKQKHWKKPPEGSHVLSTDGSVREDMAGIGGLIRDNNGFIVAAFAAGIPTAPIHVIETKAILKGVEIAMSTGVTNLIINSDSMYAVDVINGRLKTPREARGDHDGLKSAMKGFFTRFEVSHVCRTANRPADFLASFCKSEGSSLVFNSVNFPEQLKVLAAQDACH